MFWEPAINPMKMLNFWKENIVSIAPKNGL